MTNFRIAALNIVWRGFGSPAAIHAAKYNKSMLLGMHWSLARDFCYLVNVGRLPQGEARQMARNTGFVKDMKFVDLELSRDEKDACKVWELDLDGLIGYVEEKGNEGYKVGLRYDSDRGSWVASLTCAAKADSNFGWCLSAYGRDWLTALRVVAFKDAVILKGIWTDKANSYADQHGFG